MDGDGASVGTLGRGRGQIAGFVLEKHARDRRACDVLSEMNEWRQGSERME